MIVFGQSAHSNTQLCLFNFYQIQLIYNVVLVSDEHQSDSIICVRVHIYIYMYSFFTFSSIIGYFKILSIIHCAIQ